MGLKPWDLERMTTSQVEQRLDWLKAQQRHIARANDEEQQEVSD